MTKIEGLEADIHFGAIDRPLPDWREDEGLITEEDPDDELIATPPDVVAILGFDPLDIWKKDTDDLEEKYSPGQPRDESGRWSSGGGGALLGPDTGGQFGGGGGSGSGFSSYEQGTSHIRKEFGLKIRKSKKLSDSEAKESVQEISSQLSHMKEKFPTLRKSMGSRRNPPEVFLSNNRMLNKREGASRAGISGLSFDDGKMSLAKVEIIPNEKLVYGQWDVGKGLGSTFRHEYGHNCYFRATGPGGKAEWKKLASKYVKKEIGKSKVSKYGASHPEELFAESFAAYTSKNYKRGGLPNDIEETMGAILGVRSYNR